MKTDWCILYDTGLPPITAFPVTKVKMSTKSTKSNLVRVIVCPMEGSPYEAKVVRKTDMDVMLKSIQEGVEGWFEQVKPSLLKVCAETDGEGEKWAMVRRLLALKNTECYVNENGLYSHDPNLNFLPTWLGTHIHGRVVLVVRQAEWDSCGFAPDALRA